MYYLDTLKAENKVNKKDSLKKSYIPTNTRLMNYDISTRNDSVFLRFLFFIIKHISKRKSEKKYASSIGVL